NAADRINLLSATSPNALLIKDETLTDLSAQITYAASQNEQLAPLASILGQLYGQARHATSNDLFVLTTSSIIGTNSTSPLITNLPSQYQAIFGKVGVTFPLEDKYTLIPQEQ